MAAALLPLLLCLSLSLSLAGAASGSWRRSTNGVCVTTTGQYSSYLYQANVSEQTCHDACGSSSDCLAIGTLSNPSDGTACLLFATSAQGNVSGYDQVAFDAAQPSMYVHMPADGGLWPNASAECLTQQFLKSSVFLQSSDALNIPDFRFSADGQFLYAHTGASSSSPRTDVLPTWRGAYVGAYNTGRCTVGKGNVLLVTEMSSTGDVAFIFGSSPGTLYLYSSDSTLKATVTGLSDGKPHLLKFSPWGNYLLVLYAVGPTVGGWPANVEGLVLDLSAAPVQTVCRLYYWSAVAALTYQSLGTDVKWWLRELFWFTADGAYLIAPANASTWGSAASLQSVEYHRFSLADASNGHGLVQVGFDCLVGNVRFPPMGTSNVIMCSAANCNNALNCFRLFNVSRPTPALISLINLSPVAHNCTPQAGSGGFSSDGLHYSFPCGSYALFGLYNDLAAVWLINFYEFAGSSLSSMVTTTEGHFVFVSYCTALSGECYEESTFSMLKVTTPAEGSSIVGTPTLLWTLTTMQMKQAMFILGGNIIGLRFSQGFALMNSTTSDWIGESSWASYYSVIAPDRESFASLRGTTEGSEIRWVDLQSNRTSNGYCAGLAEQDITKDSCSLTRSLPHHFYSNSLTKSECLSICTSSSQCTAADYSPYLGCRIFGASVKGLSLVLPQSDDILYGDKTLSLTCTPKGTDTPTLTATPTATVVPTGTPTMTLTGRKYPVCNDTIVDVDAGLSSIVISTTKSCEAVVSLQSTVQKTFALSAYWALRIACGDATSVTVSFANVTHANKEGVVQSLEQLGPTVFSVEVVVGGAASRRVSTQNAPSVVFKQATQASGEVVALVIGLVFAVAALGTAIVLWVRWWRWRAASVEASEGMINIRVVAESATASPASAAVHTPRGWWWAFYALVVLGGACVVTAVILLPIVYALYNGAGPTPGNIITSWAFLIAGFGALLVALMVLAYCRRQLCPACEKVVWPGMGWHILVEPCGEKAPERAYPGRFHHGCTRCFECRRHIRRHLWVGSTPQRLVHDACWREACRRWMGVTEVQLVHELRDHTDSIVGHVAVLAMLEGKLGLLQAVVEERPLLWKVRLAEHHGRPLVTLALSERNEAALRVLLAYDTEELDLVTSHSLDLTKPSGYFVVAGGATDVFLLHPFVTCCDQPVGVGRYTGWYLYFMEGDAGFNEGWHLGPILGGKDQTFLCDSLPRSCRTKRTPRAAGALEEVAVPEEAEAGAADPPPTPSAHMGLAADEVHVPLMAEGAAAPAHHHEARAPFTVGRNSAMLPVYSMTSVLEQALRTGDQAIIAFIVAEYKRRLAWCAVWQWQDGHGLWHDYPDEAQGTLLDVLTAGEAAVEVSVPLDGRHHLYAISLSTLRQVPVDAPHGLAQRLRSAVPTPIFWCDSEIHESSNDIQVVLGKTLSSHDQRTTHQRCRKGTFPSDQWPMVVLDPGRLLDACNHSPTLLRLMVDEGLLEPTQWLLHGTEADLLRQCLGPSTVQEEWQQMMAAVLQAGGVPAKARCPLPLLQVSDAVVTADVCKYRRTHREKSGGRGAHLHTDGLSEPELLRQRTGLELDLDSAFYPADYHPPQPMMHFVYDLPRNPFGYSYASDAMLNVISNFVLKAAELQTQQRFADRKAAELSTPHFFGVYVYTYELPGDDQIYGVVNRCMRNNQREELLYWQPFLYHLDQAMFALPSVQARLFRGINMTFDNGAYQKGAVIRWPAYSSSSLKRSVAEEFARGSTKGTLFFLTSQTAVDISHFSRFGGEGEVLFFSNSAFEVTSTLFSDSAIGSFYSGCDNVEMRELPRQMRRPNAAPLLVSQLAGAQKQQPVFVVVPKLDHGHIVSTNAGILFIKGTEALFPPLYATQRGDNVLR